MTAAPPPANDSKTASIAWAVATIVVALVIALIAWLAMGDRGGDGSNAAGTTTGANTGASDPAPAPTAPARQPDTAGTPTEAPEQAAPQTPSPEITQMLLDLQRRDADDPMAVGEVDAPVVMIEYADYRCPYCARFHLETRPDLMPLVEDGTLRIEFRDLVLFDEPSLQAAVATRAAAEQDLMSDYQSAVFARSTEGHAELAREDLVAIAEEVGVPDLEAFETALDDPALAAAAQADTDEARALGISSTPTFLVNTAVVQGAQEADYFRSVIEQQKALAEQNG